MDKTRVPRWPRAEQSQLLPAASRDSSVITISSSTAPRLSSPHLPPGGFHSGRQSSRPPFNGRRGSGAELMPASCQPTLFLPAHALPRWPPLSLQQPSLQRQPCLEQRPDEACCCLWESRRGHHSPLSFICASLHATAAVNCDRAVWHVCGVFKKFMETMY